MVSFAVGKLVLFCSVILSALEGGTTFIWPPLCPWAFEQLKAYLSRTPFLVSPVEGGTLFMYLAVTEVVVSFVICSLRNERMMPIYYVSHVLAGVQIRYSPLGKHIFTLIISACKLKPYFQVHPVTVFTNVPLRQIMHKPDLTERTTMWVLDFSECQIDFQPRYSLQAQALVDFLVENTLLSVVKPVAMAQDLDLKKLGVVR